MLPNEMSTRCGFILSINVDHAPSLTREGPQEISRGKDKAINKEVILACKKHSNTQDLELQCSESVPAAYIQRQCQN